MPLQTDQHAQFPALASSGPTSWGAANSAGVGDLDDDLLAALDDVLSFSEPTSVVHAFAANHEPLDLGNVTLDHELDAILTEEEKVSLDNKPVAEKAAKSPGVARSGSGRSQQQTASMPGRKGKDARAAPYSKPSNPRRRKRPKDELDYLRAKVADMEEELAVLSNKPEIGSPADASASIVFNGELSSGDDATESDVLLCWRKLAARQKQEANRSVVENLRLRAVLEGQLDVARSLEAAIDQHQREAARSLPTFGSSEDGAPQSTAMSEELIFALLNESLEAQLAELDAVFELSGVARVNHDMNNGTKAHHDATGVSVRHEEVRVLPFSSDAVQRAMWGILRYSTAKEMMLGPFQTQVLNDNQMNVTMVEKLQLGKARATNTVRRFSFRRVFDKNRTVIVWGSYVELDGSVFVRLREKGYCAVSPLSFGQTTSSSGGVGIPGSLTRMVVLASPELAAAASPEQHKAHVGEMTELVVGAYRVSLGLMHQIIDTLLLREAMGGTPASPPSDTAGAT